MMRAIGRDGGRGTPDAEQELARLLRSGVSPAARRDYHFIFVVGAAGSGTTMLTRILSGPAQAVCLGGKYTTIPESDRRATRLARGFNLAITHLWDRKAPAERYNQARQVLPQLVDGLLAEEGYRQKSHVIYKRSAPFNPGDRHRPDLSDLFELFPNSRVVIIYRDPKASTYSSLRRGYAENLRASAVICEEQLTYLSAQLATLDSHCYAILNYEAFCERPEEVVGPLAALCQLPEGELLAAMRRENVSGGRNERWASELSQVDGEFLNGFFNERRLAQWPLLAATARPAGAKAGFALVDAQKQG
jgi:hypothetical protein